MSDAEEARFRAFVESTTQDERDWIAFLEFQEAAHRATMVATLANPYDADEGYSRESQGLRLALSEMLFRVLPRVDLGVVLAEVEGIGYALRFGLIPQRADALDEIADDKAFEELAAKGYAADRADSQRRMDELVARGKRRRKSKSHD